MSTEYQIWEMLACVGDWRGSDPIVDLSDASIISAFHDNIMLLVNAIQMREQGLLAMEDGKVKLKTCYENPEVVKINFPIGSKQSYIDHHISDGEDKNVNVIVCGYGYIQDQQMPHIMTFLVICQHETAVMSEPILVHPNKFIQ